MAASLLLAFGAFRPWAEVRVAAVSVKAFSLTLATTPGFGTDKGGLESIVLVDAGVLALLGILLIVTTVGWLGALWRFLAVFALVPAAGVVGYLWYAVQKDPAGVLDDPAVSDWTKVLGLTAAVLEKTGILTVVPREGLYLMTIGAACILLGLFVPAMRLTEESPGERPVSTAQNQLGNVPGGRTPAGWYRTDAGHRFWDGNSWTDNFRPYS